MDAGPMRGCDNGSHKGIAEQLQDLCKRALAARATSKFRLYGTVA